MTPQTKSEQEVARFYSKDSELMAVVVYDDGDYYVDFYRDEVIIDSRVYHERSQRYAEDVAENFVNGILKIDDKTWRVHGL